MKIHLAVDGRGRPLSILLTPGQAGDNPQLLNLLDAISVNTPGRGRPRKRPDMLIADKGYAHDSTRRQLRRRGIRHTIPERADQRARRRARGSRGGRVPAFEAPLYSGATWWNGASTDSSSGGIWLPDTPSGPRSIGRVWCWSPR